jgi:NAD(P)-dependent dehydrogenase (short-subunit alcohol dehydrogenase family)
MANKDKIDILIVTGAGDGLGKELAIAASKKIEVICISRSKNAIKVANEINKNGGKAQGLTCDLSNFHLIDAKLKSLKINKQKKLGFIFCAATLGNGGGILDDKIENWDLVFRTNVLGNLKVLQYFLPHIIKNKFSKIVFIAGGGAAYGYPKFSSYSLSKTATVRAAENLHIELEGKGKFTVLAIAPGAMKTKMLAKVIASGAKIKTFVPINETVEFLLRIINENRFQKLSGRFIHVRDDVNNFFSSKSKDDKKWFLRRTE